MHPAKSVIFFTTASGAGYGLLFWLGLYGSLGLLPAGAWFAVVGFGLALILVTAGLISSTFHLGHPERAWRALSQWRSSWLSREGVAAIVTYVPVGLYGLAWLIVGSGTGWMAILGLLTALACVATVICTSMIYGSLKAIPAWHTRWTPAAYLVFAAMSGAVLLSLLAHLWGLPTVLVTDITALVAIAAGALTKFGYWHAIGRAAPTSTAESATGLGTATTATRGKVRLIDPPHTMDNYLLTEMGYRVARKHATVLRDIVWAAAFVLPLGCVFVALLAAGVGGMIFAALAVLSMAVGLAIERWLFFAEAKHVVTLYYGESAA
ncbi:MAG: DmsC/YnfH family molybdoenzyme membrane anchor subunit [Pseudomonadota bacterium]